MDGRCGHTLDISLDRPDTVCTPVAQLDRAPLSQGGSRGFESRLDSEALSNRQGLIFLTLASRYR